MICPIAYGCEIKKNIKRKTYLIKNLYCPSKITKLSEIFFGKIK